MTARATLAGAALLFLVSAAGSAGTLGKPEPARPMPRGFFIHQSVAVDDWLYVLGGGGGPHVCFAKVQDDGSLAAWQATTPIAEGLGVNYATAAAHNCCVYLLGGMYHDAKIEKDVTASAVGVARVNDDGTLGAWQRTATLPEPTAAGAAVVAGSYLYYVGGSYQRRAFYAPILESGELGEWRETQRLISNRSGFKVFAHGRFLYAVGGAILIDRFSDIVFRAEINSDGSLGKWRRTEPLPVPLTGYAGVLVGQDVFLFGGSPARNTVYASTLGEDGHFNEWRTLEPLPFGATTVQAVCINGAVFLTGGMVPHGDGCTADVLNSVYRIPVVENAPPGK